MIALVRSLSVFIFCIACLLLTRPVFVAAQDKQEVDAKAADPVDEPKGVQRTGARIRIPLPITGAVDTNIRNSLKKMESKLPKGDPRPVVILEFANVKGASGKGSQFERCLSLAGYLSSAEMSRFRTVAYIPETVEGHAVLVALACEQIVMHPDAELGKAGADETNITEIMRQAYRETAGRRNVLPQAIALGMLDPDVQVYRVNERLYATSDEYQELKQQGKVAKSEKIVPTGEMAFFTGSDLRRKYQLISSVAENLDQLAQTMEIPASDLLLDYAMDNDWKAVRVPIEGELTNRVATQAVQMIGNAISQGKNFVLIDIDSPGGDPIACQNLLNYLAELPEDIRTVALIKKEASANAALIAYACDEIAVATNAKIGGDGSYVYSEQGSKDMQRLLKLQSAKVNRSWSAWSAFCNPRISVFKYQQPNTGIIGYFSEEEHQDLVRPQEWTKGEEITKPGVALQLTGQQMLDFGLAEVVASDIEDITLRYSITTKIETPKITWANELIAVLARPSIAYFLLFWGVVALIGELQAPGVGIPGFVAVLCFGLFFWSQFLNGTAGWLEIMLFLGGVTFVMVEIFVLPGFGIFGLGGALMIVASVVFAMQTFILPTTDYELDQVPYSMFNVLVILLGVTVAIFSAKHILPYLPIVGHAYLGAPSQEKQEEINRREMIVDLTHLMGKTGETTTPLRPSGKARFGNELVNVSSDGDLIEQGASVVAVAVHGNYITVRSVTS
ncbi:MAG: hypothetical protein COA78_34265 [Blastopirellula sp.]|nr:MAG: hypothetical protein COA78_34265 [Blastopirellula sp.]